MVAERCRLLLVAASSCWFANVSVSRVGASCAGEEAVGVGVAEGRGCSHQAKLHVLPSFVRVGTQFAARGIPRVHRHNHARQQRAEANECNPAGANGRPLLAVDVLLRHLYVLPSRHKEVPRQRAHEGRDTGGPRREGVEEVGGVNA